MKKIALISLLLTLGCGSSFDEEPIPLATDDPSQEQQEQQEEQAEEEPRGPRTYTGPIGGDRPVDPVFPDNYDPEGNHPLLIQLHGYGSNAAQTELFFLTHNGANQRGFVTLTPEGTMNQSGDRFWNLFLHTGVDDLGYLTGLIDEAVERYAVDPDRVYLLGLSNGGFMSHLIACERGDLIRGIVSFNGSSYLDAADCPAENPVQVIHVHSTLDAVVPYYGDARMPSAQTITERWADFNGCDPEPTVGPRLDLTSSVAGDETTTQIWDDCIDDRNVELWSIQGGTHVPFPLTNFPELMFDALR